MAGTRNYQSIGEVLVDVKTEFPDITISKIRFLEAEGLIDPERTPSGYRKFYADDVERLKSILRMQRDEYLPLKVIKERLLKPDAGDEEEPSRRSSRPSAEASRSGRSPRSSPRRRRACRCRSRRCRRPPGSTATGSRSSRRSASCARTVPEGGRYYDGDDYIIAVDRQGLPALRDRAAAPHDVQALRRPRVVVLRGARGARRFARRTPTRGGRRPDPRRADGDLAEVQAGAAAQRTARTPARRVSPAAPDAARSPALLVVAVVLAIGSPPSRLPPPATRPPPDPGAAAREPVAVPHDRSRRRRTRPRDPRSTRAAAPARRPRHRPGAVREGADDAAARSPASRRS